MKDIKSVAFWQQILKWQSCNRRLVRAIWQQMFNTLSELVFLVYFFSTSILLLSIFLSECRYRIQTIRIEKKREVDKLISIDVYHYTNTLPKIIRIRQVVKNLCVPLRHYPSLNKTRNLRILEFKQSIRQFNVPVWMIQVRSVNSYIRQPQCDRNTGNDI